MKFLNKMKAGLAAGALAVSGAASAVGPDLSALNTAVDFSTTQTSILNIGAALAGVYVVLKAVGLVLGRIKR